MIFATQLHLAINSSFLVSFWSLETQHALSGDEFYDYNWTEFLSAVSVSSISTFIILIWSTRKMLEIKKGWTLKCIFMWETDYTYRVFCLTNRFQQVWHSISVSNQTNRWSSKLILWILSHICKLRVILSLLIHLYKYLYKHHYKPT